VASTVPPLHSATSALVKVAGSSVNPVYPSLPASFPSPLGMDMAGTVVAVGDGCKRLRVGDRVWADLANDGLGAYADFTTVEESHLGLVPPSLSLLEAASLPLVSMTSRAALHAAGAPWAAYQSWDAPIVVILGGSGGCGAVAVQMAAHGYGAAAVYATTSAANLAFVQSLGASRVFDYHTQDWAAIVGNNSVDVVYDTVGVPGTADIAMGPLRSGGTFVTIAGDLSSHPKAGVAQHFISGWLKNATALDEIARLVTRGALRPTIQRTFQLAEVSAAFNLSAQGQVVGKLSINVSSPA
jgi:alcohol dehydrogenase